MVNTNNLQEADKGWIWCESRELRTHISVCYLWKERGKCKGCLGKEVVPQEKKTKKIGVAMEPVKKRKRRSKKNQPIEGQLSLLKE